MPQYVGYRVLAVESYNLPYPDVIRYSRNPAYLSPHYAPVLLLITYTQRFDSAAKSAGNPTLYNPQHEGEEVGEGSLETQTCLFQASLLCLSKQGLVEVS